MNKEEMLKRLKDIHLLYSMPMMAQNMRPEHYAIVEYEKLAYEQQAIIDLLTNNWNELEEWVKSEYNRYYNDTENLVLSNVETMDYSRMLDKMKEIQNGSDDNEYRVFN